MGTIACSGWALTPLGKGAAATAVMDDVLVTISEKECVVVPTSRSEYVTVDGKTYQQFYGRAEIDNVLIRRRVR